MDKYFEKKITSEEKFKGKVITVTVDTVELQNGEASLREVVHHNGGAAVIAINKKYEIALVKQFRYAVGKTLIEIPAGKIEIGEDPLSTAKRELEEEAACVTANIQPFGSIIPTCGFCNEVIYIYLATELGETKQNLDPGEFVDIEWISLTKAAEMVFSGEIIDSKSAYAILKAHQLYLQNNLSV